LFHNVVPRQRLSREFNLSPAKRKGHPATGRPFLQGRIVPTEAIPSKLSGENLMSRKREVSSNFCEINTFVFNNMNNKAISGAGVPF
jgi:hypothetical protein